MATYPNPETKNALVADCRRCPALVESRECISWGNGPLDADLLVVGEAPGAGTPEAEQWQGGNWTGMAYTARHSGRKVRDLFAELGFGPEGDAGDCYYTNAVKCFPEGEDGSNREPTDEERANCRSYLAREIETIEPRVVVATGKHATRSVLALDDRELDGFLDSVLDPVALDRLGTTLLPILHPSYQEVWIARLDHTSESYRDAIGAALSGIETG